MTNIPRIAFGSLATTPGDSILHYTADVSIHARGINGIFVDNPPVLATEYATLVWRYYADTDRYTFIHVQGSHAVFPAQGRVYPYRAAAELSRTDAIELTRQAGRFPIAAIFDAMPRIDDAATQTSQRTTAETNVDLTRRAPATTEANTLAHNILHAIYSGRELHVELPAEASCLRANTIFDAPQLATLLAAIEHLPAALARYVTFAFCADERHAAVTDDVLVKLYPAGHVPDGVAATPWAELVATPRPYTPQGLADSRFFGIAAQHLPGNDAPLLTARQMVDDFRKRIANYAKLEQQGCADLEADQLDVWLGPLGHGVDELPAGSWAVVARFCARLQGTPHLKTYVRLHRDEALAYATLDGLNAKTAKDFALTPDELAKLRPRAFQAYWATYARPKRSDSLDFLFTGKSARQYLLSRFEADPALLLTPIKGNLDHLVDTVRSLPFVGADLWQRALKARPAAAATSRNASATAGSASTTAGNASATAANTDPTQHLDPYRRLARQAVELAASKDYPLDETLRQAHAIAVWTVAERCLALMRKAMFAASGSLRQKGLAAEFAKVALAVVPDNVDDDNLHAHQAFETIFLRHFALWNNASRRTLADYLPRLDKALDNQIDKHSALAEKAVGKADRDEANNKVNALAAGRQLLDKILKALGADSKRGNASAKGPLATADTLSLKPLKGTDDDHSAALSACRQQRRKWLPAALAGLLALVAILVIWLCFFRSPAAPTPGNGTPEAPAQQQPAPTDSTPPVDQPEQPNDSQTQPAKTQP